MRTALALLLFGALFASLGPTIQPVAAMARSIGADCCQEMATGKEAGDCGKQMPKSKEDRQCCSACTLGLTLAFDHSPAVVAPSSRPEIFTALSRQQRSRSERPPTPPPRCLFS